MNTPEATLQGKRKGIVTLAELDRAESRHAWVMRRRVHRRCFAIQ